MVEVAYAAPVLVLGAGLEPALMNMNKTLRVALPILLLVGVALMIPTAAADPVAAATALPDTLIKFRTCTIATVTTNTLTVNFIVGSATVNGRTICV